LSSFSYKLVNFFLKNNLIYFWRLLSLVLILNELFFIFQNRIRFELKLHNQIHELIQLTLLTTLNLICDEFITTPFQIIIIKIMVLLIPLKSSCTDRSQPTLYYLPFSYRFQFLPRLSFQRVEVSFMRIWVNSLYLRMRATIRFAMRWVDLRCSGIDVSIVVRYEFSESVVIVSAYLHSHFKL